MELVEVARALASEPRLKILEWLKAPAEHFVSQREHDLSEHGVCVALIAHQLGVSQPTTSRHLEILRRAGLTRQVKVAQWTFHQRDEDGLGVARRLLSAI